MRRQPVADDLTYTWAEMEALRLLVAAGKLPGRANSDHDPVIEAAAAVIDLAERIKREREALRMKR